MAMHIMHYLNNPIEQRQRPNILIHVSRSWRPNWHERVTITVEIKQQKNLTESHLLRKLMLVPYIDILLIFQYHPISSKYVLVSFSLCPFLGVLPYFLLIFFASIRAPHHVPSPTWQKTPATWRWCRRKFGSIACMVIDIVYNIDIHYNIHNYSIIYV